MNNAQMSTYIRSFREDLRVKPLAKIETKQTDVSRNWLEWCPNQREEIWMAGSHVYVDHRVFDCQMVRCVQLLFP